jgi:hypothetical protein
MFGPTIVTEIMAYGRLASLIVTHLFSRKYKGVLPHKAFSS